MWFATGAHVLFLCWYLHTTDALSCYNCTNVASLPDCQHNTTCGNEESCFLTKAHTDQGLRYNLGCLANQQCPHNVPSTGSNLIGRSITRRDGTCEECCAFSNCNKHLCAQDDVCLDDPSYHCADISSLFDVCLNVHHAKLVCRKFCNLCSLVDGLWAPWTDWSSCGVTCGNGTKSRTRTCTDPAPANGGLNCPGANSDHLICPLEACPIHGGWTSWSAWGTCSVSCGVGMQESGRSCSNPYPSRFGDHCFGNINKDRICIPKACTDGNWGSWSTWGNCSVSCGNGQRHRDRQCDNPAPSLLGQTCQGSSEQTDICINKACNDGQWGSWNSWGTCSVTCGGGLRTRTRLCNNPAPSLMGQFCQGSSLKTETCGIVRCHDGNWGSWNSWGSCTATCDGGLRTRTRLCNNPTPSLMGQFCQGSSLKTEICGTKPCHEMFSAFSAKTPNGYVSSRMTFSSTIYNNGGDYGTSTGTFTCSKPGVYYFAVSLVKKRTSTRTVDQVGCILKKNASQLLKVWVDPKDDTTDEGSAQAAGSTVIHLNRGDYVYLTGCYSGNKTYYESWSSFSGFLVNLDA